MLIATTVKGTNHPGLGPTGMLPGEKCVMKGGAEVIVKINEGREELVMSDNTKILVRNAREQDIPAVVEIDTEAFSAYGTAEAPETFQLRLRAFPDGFIILIADNEVAAYATTEKWLTEREPALDENPLATHQPDGRILCITAMAVKKKYRGRGYGSRLLDKLKEIAHGERCQKIVLETTHAQAFLLKRGFQTVQNRRERGASLDVMALDLESAAPSS